jgi:FSR family fosmidomycin resistance protein-like MFS transporter
MTAAPVSARPGARADADGATDATAPRDAAARRADDVRVVTVVGIAHGCSHFFQLIVIPVFPWIRSTFELSYAELGLLMTVFYVVSGFGQALAGFLVDRVGAVPVMLASLGAFVLAALSIAFAPGYAWLMLGLAVAGLGNAAFHPVDYSILNARIDTPRLAHAYSVHGITGSFGWALAPVFLVGLTQLANWRVAVGAAGGLAAAVALLVWVNRHRLAGRPVGLLGVVPAAPHPVGAPAADTFAFLRLRAVWLSFAFFLVMSVSFGAIQTFGPESAGQLHGVEPRWVALCLTAYMLASAAGIVAGGFVASDPHRAEPTIAVGYGVAAALALVLGFASVPGWAVPVLFAAIGASSGIAGPSRDLLVRRASPPGATGRVYGLVYSGLDAGMALSPLVFGWLMDHRMTSAVWVGIAAFQALLILTAVNVGRAAPARVAATAAN